MVTLDAGCARKCRKAPKRAGDFMAGLSCTPLATTWRPPREGGHPTSPLPPAIGAIFKACFLEATSYWRQRVEKPRQPCGSCGDCQLAGPGALDSFIELSLYSEKQNERLVGDHDSANEQARIETGILAVFIFSFAHAPNWPFSHRAASHYVVMKATYNQALPVRCRTYGAKPGEKF